MNAKRRAHAMTIGTATVVLQLSATPEMLGCAEVVAHRLTRATAGGPAVCGVVFGPSISGRGQTTPRYYLTMYGLEVKAALLGMVSLPHVVKEALEYRFHQGEEWGSKDQYMRHHDTQQGVIRAAWVTFSSEKGMKT